MTPSGRGTNRKPKLDAKTFDEMAADLERERTRRMWESWMKLWREGDFTAGQGKLIGARKVDRRPQSR